MKIVIRAGGVGSRLWPMSRESQPKQLQRLISHRTMLEDALLRVKALAKPQDIFVSCNTACARVAQETLKEIPGSNVIVEPARRDTAAAVGLESIYIRRQDPQAIVASLGSDHSIKREEEFRKMLKLAEEFVRRHPKELVLLGVKPTYPDTGYGYIRLGEALDTFEGKNLYRVDHFTEKPDVGTAKEFIKEGNYLWNANMFVWRVDTILDLYKKYMPEMYALLMKIETAIGTAEEAKTLAEVYPQMEKIAVDYAILEKSKQISALSADIGWSDIGDWARLKDEMTDLESDNLIRAEHISIETKNSLVYGPDKKMIVTIGVENLVIVDTPDALLVCDKYHAMDVKKIVDQLKENNREDLL